MCENEKMPLGAGEMTQCLSTLVAPAEDPVSIPSPPCGSSQPSLNSDPREPKLSSDFCGCASVVHPYTRAKLVQTK